MIEIKRWNAVFLIDKIPPKKILLLKRSPKKQFAPNFYTGIGGKIGDLPEFKNETPLESAYRELFEETEGNLSKKNIKLREFARCIYEDGLRLYYFCGKHTNDALPRINPEDGTLIWVNTNVLLKREFIPTAQAICEEWFKRSFTIDQPFTVYVRETGVDRTVRLITVLDIKEGLH